MFAPRLFTDIYTAEANEKQPLASTIILSSRWEKSMLHPDLRHFPFLKS